MKREEPIGKLTIRDKCTNPDITRKMTTCEEALAELSADMDAGIVSDCHRWLLAWNIWVERRDTLRRGVMVFW